MAKYQIPDTKQRKPDLKGYMKYDSINRIENTALVLSGLKVELAERHINN